MAKTKKNIWKWILTYIISLLIYMLPSVIIKTDIKFYDSLKGTFVPKIVFVIVWSLIFILQSILNMTYFMKRKELDKKENKRYYLFTIINYIFIILFLISMNISNSLFFGYVTTLLCSMSAILMSMQSLLLNKKLTLVMLPYVLWSIFATIYSVILYIKN